MTSSTSVLVTGATGNVGRALVDELLAAGNHVRAGVRDLAHADLPAGAEPVQLDFADASSVGPALDGVDRLFLMRPPAISDVRTALGPLVAAAAERQVRHVVVLSVMGVNPALPHWRLERMVAAAGLRSTALRPAYFAQNLISPLGDNIRDRSELRLAAGNGRVSFVDVHDIAAVAAAVLTEPDRYDEAALTLTGPRALTFGDAAAVLTAELGRLITYVPQGLVERRRELQAQHLESAYIWVQLVIDATTRLGLARGVTQDIPRILGRPAISFEQFVRDNRAAWRPVTTLAVPQHS